MKRARSTSSALSNPVLVGAVTLLVTLVAVFLSYNANQGLPFVPTYQLETVVPDAHKLVEGNEVREGGFRIGIVSRIEPRELRDGTAGANLVLKLDQNAAPVPADSTMVIRPKSALGLKYVELQRGDAADTLPDGSSITVDETALAPELQQFFDIFDAETRRNVQRNLTGFGNAFAYRGVSINRALESLPGFLRSVVPVMRVLADENTRLERFFDELADAARVTAPVVDQMADGFRAGAQTFEALARDRPALQATIEKSPDTLAVGTRSLRAQRPFLNRFASLSDDLRSSARELRGAAPVLTGALRSGIEPLGQMPALNRRLATTLGVIEDVTSAPGVDIGLAGLNEMMVTLNPSLRYLGPFVTVCNYWNYWWTYLADHLTDEEQTGTIQRVQAKSVDGEQADFDNFGEPRPVEGLHIQSYGAAIDDQGNADCESGQRGYPRQLASGVPAQADLAVDPETPGNQGPTFTGRPKVLPTQTFSRDPERGPRIRP